MKISRKDKNLIKTIISVILCICVIFAIVALINNINEKSKENLIKIHPTFEVGGLTDYGKYKNTKTSIYNKDSFECQGLKISLDFDSNIQYQVFYYNDTDNFISSSDIYTEGGSMNVPSGAFRARLLITPIWDTDIEESEKELNILKIRKYSKQITIEVNKKQLKNELVYEKIDIENTFELYEDILFTETGSSSSNGDYDSYKYIADELCAFYFDDVSFSDFQYIIKRTNGTCEVYKKSSTNWVYGKENAFSLNNGDVLILSCTNQDEISRLGINLYIGKYKLI